MRKGVVVLDRAQYVEKTEEILSDDAKFERLSGDWLKLIIRCEDKLNRFLRNIKSKIPERLFSHLFASGSKPGILYG